jgi:hypothetical protein
MIPWSSTERRVTSSASALKRSVAPWLWLRVSFMVICCCSQFRHESPFEIIDLADYRSLPALNIVRGKLHIPPYGVHAHCASGNIAHISLGTRSRHFSKARCGRSRKVYCLSRREDPVLRYDDPRPSAGKSSLMRCQILFLGDLVRSPYVCAHLQSWAQDHELHFSPLVEPL